MTAITESEIRASINIQLSALGWQLDARKSGRNVYCERPKTADEKKRLGAPEQAKKSAQFRNQGEGVYS